MATVPKWSPDGRQIAFNSVAGTAGLYLVAASGGDPKLTSRHAGGELHPSWSPDGAELMYSDIPWKQPQKVAVHILHLATGQLETVPGSQGLFVPQWSPDGRYAAASALDQRIMLFDFATHTWS